jgi:hypothetical protein
MQSLAQCASARDVTRIVRICRCRVGCQGATLWKSRLDSLQEEGQRVSLFIPHIREELEACRQQAYAWGVNEQNTFHTYWDICYHGNNSCQLKISTAS